MIRRTDRINFVKFKTIKVKNNLNYEEQIEITYYRWRSNDRMMIKTAAEDRKTTAEERTVIKEKENAEEKALDQNFLAWISVWKVSINKNKFCWTLHYNRLYYTILF